MWNASQWFRLTQLLLLVFVFTTTEYLLGDRLTVIYLFYNILSKILWHEKVSRHYLVSAKRDYRYTARVWQYIFIIIPYFHF